MRKFFLKHCKIYRMLVCKIFGKYKVSELSIPFGIYGDFNYHYLGFDKDGKVHKGFKNIVDVIKNKGNLGITVVYDGY